MSKFVFKLALSFLWMPLVFSSPIVSASNWEEVQSPTNKNLRDIHMLSSDEGWVVGDNGIILRWNGKSWENFDSPTKYELASVYFASVSDGWAVGDNGIILRWNGSFWSKEIHPIENVWLNSVFMPSSDDGWIVGGHGTILRWNGVSWENFPSPTSNNLQSIHMASSDIGWAVGVSGTILKWNGSSWRNLDLKEIGGGNSWCVYALSSEEFVITGDGGVGRWVEESWVGGKFLRRTRFISAHFSSREKGWATGFYFTELENRIKPTEGIILEYDGTSWREVLTTPNPLADTYALPSGEVWAVGNNGTILRRIVKEESQIPPL